MPRRQSLVVLVLAAVFTALAASGCGGDDSTTPAEPALAEPTPAPEPAPEPTPEPAAAGDAEAGATVFADAGCGGCHGFAAAGASGGIGPNLDEAAPLYDEIVDVVTNGAADGHPAFGDELSPEEIQDVAAFVVERRTG